MAWKQSGSPGSEPSNLGSGTWCFVTSSSGTTCSARASGRGLISSARSPRPSPLGNDEQTRSSRNRRAENALQRGRSGPRASSGWPPTRRSCASTALRTCRVLELAHGVSRKDRGVATVRTRVRRLHHRQDKPISHRDRGLTPKGTEHEYNTAPASRPRRHRPRAHDRRAGASATLHPCCPRSLTVSATVSAGRGRFPQATAADVLVRLRPDAAGQSSAVLTEAGGTLVAEELDLWKLPARSAAQSLRTSGGIRQRRILRA